MPSQDLNPCPCYRPSYKLNCVWCTVEWKVIGNLECRISKSGPPSIFSCDMEWCWYQLLTMHRWSIVFPMVNIDCKGHRPQILKIAMHCQDKIPKFWNKYSQTGNIGVSVPGSTFMRLWVIYIFPPSVCLFCWRKYVDRSWDYINCSQTHRCGNWGWGRAIPRRGIHKWDFRCSVPKKSQHFLLPEVLLTEVILMSKTA